MSETVVSDREARKRAAQHLLIRGLATYAEIAELTGVSRQAVRQQGVRLGAETARELHLARIWQKALLMAPSPPKP